MVKGSTQQDITIVNIYALNPGAPKYIKQILIDINREINSNTIIIVGNINTPLSSMGLPAFNISDSNLRHSSGCVVAPHYPH